MKVVDTYKALGDPVRLKMVQRLSSHSAYTVGTLSEGLGVTRQGARKHLGILQEAQLVTLIQEGRKTTVLLNPFSLAKAKAFIAELEQQWDMRLKALKAYSEQ